MKTSRVSKITGIILKIKRNVPAEIVVTLYHTLIQPYLNYCNIFEATTVQFSSRISLGRKKKAVSIIINSKWNTHTQPIFRNLYLLTLFNINKMQIYCVMYKIVHKLLPLIF